MKLHDFYRSTASWRVRIALAIKGLSYEPVFHHLRLGEHRAPAYLGLNPQGLVPSLETGDGAVLTQSLAICEYLEEVRPHPALLPADPLDRARVRAFAQVIACDIHPIQNLRVLGWLREAGLDEEAVAAWARRVIHQGLDACDALLPAHGGRFCFGDAPTLADLCLVPQLANARRFGVELVWPRILEIEAAALATPAFADTAPARRPDAE